MKNHRHAYRTSGCKALSATSLALLLASPLPGTAATDLADVPLFNATTVDVLPNIFFIFDNSGSMTYHYMPDYVKDDYCKRSATQRRNCVEGDPPFNNAAFNGTYYDPTVTYSPPRDAAGNIKAGWNGWLASSGNWTSVPKDGYKTIDSGTINLTTGNPERVWCNNSDVYHWSAVCLSSIDAANNYTYPSGAYLYPKTIYVAPHYYTATVEWCSAGGTPWGTSPCQENRTATFNKVKYSNWTQARILPTTTSYAKAATRTDCAGATCTYADEMANYANWYAWYRTRQQMMKTAVSLVFNDVRGTPDVADPLDKNYFHARVGFTTISNTGTTDGTGYLGINNFDGTTVGTTTQRGKFFDRLFKADGGSWTPLRGALTKAGRLYGGKIGTDPVQYSCQRNYTILSTDGYWNKNDESCKNSFGSGVSCTDAGGTNTPVYSAAKLDGSSWIGDMDGSTSCSTDLVTPMCNASGTCTPNVVTRPECDTNRKGNTLADIAYYYYHTDLRPGTCAKCTDNVPGSSGDARTNDVADWQHMTTYTIGLGVDGTLKYSSGYKTATSGDYADIKAGTKAWPDPITNDDEERIDDLWHAAVDGRGTYFSAQNPTSLTAGLRKALTEMNAKNGAGASAAASSLQPTAGDNFAYVASYQTIKWDGDVTAHTIDPESGAVSPSALWQAQPLLNTRITGACGSSDDRTIYTGSTTIKPFTWADLSTTERTYFDTSKLDQWASWTPADRTAATGETLVNYLRGHNLYENQERDTAFATACPSYRPLYRDRENVLGDIVHSQPVYLKQPKFNFSDTGYAAFKATPRDARLFIAANDGMLHALDAASGNEEWAYIPPMALKNIYELAGEFYSTNHQYFLDGPITVADINDGGWKTILVGALGKGGRGIYALDVTSTGAGYPKVLWNFSAEGPDGVANTADDNPNLGFTYGMPLVTKLKDGTWVVLVASGYNNVPDLPNPGDFPSADGVGRVFVIRAADGVLLKTISTGVGTPANPSGLSSLNAHALNLATDNTAERAYGGDLFGNLWGFDLDAGTVYQIASVGKPISTAPEISVIDTNTVLFFGTGRYLGQTDLESFPPATVYGIKDNDGGAVITEANLVEQTMSGSRTLTTNSVDWSTKSGWFVDLLAGELVSLPAQLYGPVLIVATVSPAASACEPGGTGYLYGFNFRTGSASDNKADTVAGTYYASPLVGFTVFQTTTGKGKLLVVSGSGSMESKDPPPEPGLGRGEGTRVIWHEMID